MIEELHPPTKESLDRCYVNNFKLTDRPRLLALPRGQANAFKKDMQAGIDFLRRRIPQVFEGEPFQRQKGRIVERFTVREKELMDDFTRRIAREQFALGHMQVGAVALPEIFPVLEGQMVPIEDISKMVHEGKLDSPVAEEIERKCGITWWTASILSRSGRVRASRKGRGRIQMVRRSRGARGSAIRFACTA